MIAALPKAELHLHLEGSIEPATLPELAARHGVVLTHEEAAARYVYENFAGFLEAFKWVTTFLRTPADYALITERLAEGLLGQNVVYAEVMISVGVMLRRKQDADANLQAIQGAAQLARKRGLRMQWILDATRQFGPAAAMEVARHAARCKSLDVVAFGMGGDELSIPIEEFRKVYEYAAGQGLHRVVHAGEVGGPESVRDAVELLGAERIGHGIAVIRDPAARDLLADQRIALELCPTSNICTGALARQLGHTNARVEDHPMRDFLAQGLGVTLSTDDPAMFQTTLVGEYSLGPRMGLDLTQMMRIAEMGFEFAFLPAEEKRSLLETFRARTNALRLV